MAGEHRDEQALTEFMRLVGVGTPASDIKQEVDWPWEDGPFRPDERPTLATAAAGRITPEDLRAGARILRDTYGFDPSEMRMSRRRSRTFFLGADLTDLPKSVVHIAFEGLPEIVIDPTLPDDKVALADTRYESDFRNSVLIVDA